MNFFKNIVLIVKISAAMLGFKTVDFFRDEVNAKLAPLRQEIKLSYEKGQLNKNLESINLSPREIYMILNEKNINNLSPQKIDKMLKNVDHIMTKNIDNINWEIINDIVNDADFETIQKWNLILREYNFYKHYLETNKIFNN
ncbi:hypothetical protein [Candidatus Phytoplasma bonamiae]|uniref:Uncharacterized protein n=1 Tax=Candidatus Phytoplasma bonamiae TaxID=2982626 RepID=A0ABT9D457_9MOLU|nr:hypothetical protein ['Bonamia sp.' little leaf phytoplasma]MDO8064208.1 hypothetical protein ['Bonamia sp.' little leaf phytoplasma]